VFPRAAGDQHDDVHRPFDERNGRLAVVPEVKARIEGVIVVNAGRVKSATEFRA